MMKYKSLFKRYWWFIPIAAGSVIFCFYVYSALFPVVFGVGGEAVQQSVVSAAKFDPNANQGARITQLLDNGKLHTSTSVFGMTKVTCDSVVAEVQDHQAWGYYIDFYRLDAKSFACADCFGGRCHWGEIRVRFFRDKGFAQDAQHDFAEHTKAREGSCIAPPDWESDYFQTIEAFGAEAQWALNQLEQELRSRPR